MGSGEGLRKRERRRAQASECPKSGNKDGIMDQGKAGWKGIENAGRERREIGRVEH